MQWLQRLPITSKTQWDLLVVVSQLSEAEQEALLHTLRVRQYLTPDDQAWLTTHRFTWEDRP